MLQIRELHDRISTNASESDGRLKEFRTDLSNRTDKVEQQLEWYMRYSKTLSTLVGDLESKLSIVHQAQSSLRDDFLNSERALESDLRVPAETVHASSGSPSGPNLPSSARFRSSRATAMALESDAHISAETLHASGGRVAGQNRSSSATPT